ncbi:MAG: ABC transporter ATP-binding protein [Armatimonadota bacterium]|nr:ABC transporter ATP-binding protein [Armatimonadota bacterium]MDR7427357.1 ABC transporter ATP-binding protein [Armatimonadota bacterium]MDR7464875.1 ABC transporter ATP-binding protein [Armatimonadota bacterium]MDR7468703.1 ABC transporter ATP-binding protein [Armatimonadota bacterium]MDR7474382.1 ABC transporter ATP-binding protein [Armatimonadota bacterium]
MLSVEGLATAYDDIPILRDVSLKVRRGEAVGVIGPNGAGKTTLLRTIAGLVRPRAGSIAWEGLRLDELPAHVVARLGIVYVPAERELFPQMTVLEHLRLGTYPHPAGFKARVEFVYDLFPRLAERRHQRAGTLSGGEQQMLAIARGVMMQPQVLLLDEPSTGLAPLLVAELYHQLGRLRDAGLTVLLAEQQVPRALEFCERLYVLENGEVVLAGAPDDLLADSALKRAYLGVA